ncbi:MAG: hypothetical protein ACR2RB_00050 [Gammaproteobacteria bacterium]
MPIPLPNLDDRSHADLVAEAQALIPGLCPEWTNHNPSDPGIVLIEMLAWLTEMLLYQVNEVPDENIETFLGLLGWTKPQGQAKVDLDAATRDTLLGLRRKYRAVTAKDFELLAHEQWPQSAAARNLGADGKIKRVTCVPQRNLAATDAAQKSRAAPAHVSVVVIADTPNPYARLHRPLADALHEFFRERCLLTTRHHVVGPDFVAVRVSATLFLREDALPDTTLNRVIETLYGFFDPLHGGPEKTGWPFGRDVYASEVYALFDNMPLIDSVENVSLDVGGEQGRVRSEAGAAVSVTLDAHELVAIEVSNVMVIDASGNPHTSDVIGVVGYQRLG